MPAYIPEVQPTRRTNETAQAAHLLRERERERERERKRERVDYEALWYCLVVDN